MSARMMASKKPANIPAKCPTKSTLGEMVDIMMQLVHLQPVCTDVFRVKPHR